VARVACRLDKTKRGDVKTYANLEDVLADPLVDVVDLVLPIPAMPSAIEKCLRAGKSVISEKPVAPSPELVGRLWAQYHRSAADQSGKCCWCVVENWVAKPAVLHVHRLLQSHAIGVIEGYICRLSLAVPTLDQQGWRKQDRAREGELTCPGGVAPNEREGHYEGGWGLDVGVHLIRAVRKWFGAVTSVTSVAADSKRGRTHPNTETSRWSEQMGGVLQHESGLQGSVHFEFFAPEVAGDGVRGQQAMEATSWPEGHDVRHGVRVWGEKVCFFPF
jgi:predicted dehydrogenase